MAGSTRHATTDPARMHHAMVVHAYYPLAETRVQREAEALVAAGRDVDVICLKLPEEQAVEIVNGVTVHRVPVRRRRRAGGRRYGAQLLEYVNFTIRSAWYVARLHRRSRFAVVQVHNPPDFLILAGLVPRLFGARLIIDLHDLMPEFLASKLGASMGDPRVRLAALQERIACALADHVITVTEPWRRTLIERGSATAERSSVVLNVADPAYFSPAMSIAPPREPDEFRLIYHGTQAYRYGIDILLRAVDRLRSEMPELRLTLHGRGEAREELAGLVTALGLGDIVEISSEFVPVAELPRIILRADLGVVPYRRDVFTDGILPTKLMEYAVLGMPAIAARTTAIEAYFDRSMVEFVEPGDLEDLVDRIRALRHDPERRRAMGQAMADFSVRHAWPIESARYVELVDRLARGTGVGSGSGQASAVVDGEARR